MNETLVHERVVKGMFATIGPLLCQIQGRNLSSFDGNRGEAS